MQKKSLFSPVHRANHWIWLGKPQARHWKISQRISRAVLHVAREVFKGNLQQSALGLSYITLLSLVPLLAVSFSVLKAFGSDQVIEPFLATLLAPLGHSAPELTEQITGFVSNIKVGVLGTLGIALLFYTVISLMQKIETVFNGIWQVHHLRQLATRISMYLSVLLVGPVLVLAAMGLTASLLSNQLITDLTQYTGFGVSLGGLTWLFPLLLWIAVFTFIYKAIPNTSVTFSAALVGGIVAAFLWNGVGLAFGVMIAGSAQYTAIYSAFASLILFMVWLQLAWLIVLVGASASFAWQRTDQLQAMGHTPINAHHQLMIAALEALSLVDARFEAGLNPPSTQSLKTQLTGMPAMDPLLLDQAISALQTAQLIYPQGTAEDSGWLPAKPAKRVSVADVRAALWGTPKDMSSTQAPEPHSDFLAEPRAPIAAYQPITQHWLALEQESIEPQLRALTLEINHGSAPPAPPGDELPAPAPRHPKPKNPEPQNPEPQNPMG
ncbi:MAG TPA: YihY/virulence factor BrkB family protein [Halothiobacillus sp.]|nr:YihY/virulence factor BrkB family protein [Halothiobacillus sp.]HQS28187.1 YihY/virulence factor BrkB family protein [Halothiobacillus sp.]